MIKSCAREISGRRCRGSFCGNGLSTNRVREPVMSTTMLQSGKFARVSILICPQSRMGPTPLI